MDIPWYNHHAAERPLLSGDKLPALTLPSANQAPVSGYPSLRASGPDTSPAVSSGSSNPSSRTSISGYSQSSVNDIKSPPPSTDIAGRSQNRLSLDSSAHTEYSVASNSVGEAYYQGQNAIGSMNQTQPYMDVHSSHLSSAQPYASQGATAGSLTHYQPYQQPPVLHPGSTTYASTGSYSHYGYANGVTSPQAASQPPTTSMTSQVPAQLLPLPGKFLIVSVYGDSSL